MEYIWYDYGWDHMDTKHMYITPTLMSLVRLSKVKSSSYYY